MMEILQKIRFQAYVANNKFAIFLPILLYMYFVCHEQDWICPWRLSDQLPINTVHIGQIENQPKWHCLFTRVRCEMTVIPGQSIHGPKYYRLFRMIESWHLW